MYSISQQSLCSFLKESYAGVRIFTVNNHFCKCAVKIRLKVTQYQISRRVTSTSHSLLADIGAGTISSLIGVYIITVRRQFWGIIIGSKTYHANTLCDKNGLYAFGYNSAESEPIWVKSGKMWAKCWGLAMTDFELDLRSSDRLRGSRYVFLWGK